MSKQLWGGRFSSQKNQAFASFNQSLSFDFRLLSQDIEGSMAYAKALHKVGGLSEGELTQILEALSELEETTSTDQTLLTAAIEEGTEDVHSFVETELVKKIGDVGKKLHTARSRNDQVATDMRMWVRQAISEIFDEILELQKTLVNNAKLNQDAVLPGYTHLQRAQPVLWSHLMLCYADMLSRDFDRFKDVHRRADVLPLGSGALSGNSWNVDRDFLAKELNFSAVSTNSLDATSDRDYIVEFISAASLTMAHMSRIAEDLIIYSSSEFKFVTMGDDVATGSSLMPQKKNPDALELIRGKTGRTFGSLIQLLTVIKALPTCYNKDLQEDKEALFDTFDTLSASLQVMKSVIASLELNKDKMLEAASKGYQNATELADYLVKKGVAFRDAHHAVGRLVLTAISCECELQELPLEKLQTECEAIEADVYKSLSLDATIASKASFGGTSPVRVAEAIKTFEAKITDLSHT